MNIMITWMHEKLRQPFSGLSHLVGAVLGMVGLVWVSTLSNRLVMDGFSVMTLVGVYIFLVFMILLFLSSAVYHLSFVSEKTQKMLRRVDHMMIYLFIAASYTPICLGPLRAGIGIKLLILVWLLAIVGVLKKIFWLHAPRWFSVGLYLGLGWLAMISFAELKMALSPYAMNMLFAEGFFYSAGAVVYAVKRPDPFPEIFGFHEIWHLFVLAGAFCHFLIIKNLIIL